MALLKTRSAKHYAQFIAGAINAAKRGDISGIVVCEAVIGSLRFEEYSSDHEHAGELTPAGHSDQETLRKIIHEEWRQAVLGVGPLSGQREDG